MFHANKNLSLTIEYHESVKNISNAHEAYSENGCWLMLWHMSSICNQKLILIYSDSIDYLNKFFSILVIKMLRFYEPYRSMINSTLNWYTHKRKDYAYYSDQKQHKTNGFEWVGLQTPKYFLMHKFELLSFPPQQKKNFILVVVKNRSLLFLILVTHKEGFHSLTMPRQKKNVLKRFIWKYAVKKKTN